MPAILLVISGYGTEGVDIKCQWATAIFFELLFKIMAYIHRFVSKILSSKVNIYKQQGN